MTPLEEFATDAALLGLGVYAADATSSIFLKQLPDQPDLAIAISRYGGGEASAATAYDELRLQYRIRGPNTDMRAVEAKAQDVYDKLHGLHGRTLPGGTWLVHMIGINGGPIDMGVDEHGRPEYVVNFRAEVNRPTPNRGL